MKLQRVNKMPSGCELSLVFLPKGGAPSCADRELGLALEEHLKKDPITVEHCEFKELRLKVGENYQSVLLCGFDSLCKSPYSAFRKFVLKLGASAPVQRSARIFADGFSALTFTEEREAVKQFSSLFPLCEYTFDLYKSDRKPKEEKSLFVSEKWDEEALREGGLLARANRTTRDLVNRVADDLTPAVLAQTCCELGKNYGFETEVFDEDYCEKIKMDLFLAVARGSVKPPKLIVMRYHGGGEEAPFGLIAKGLTYDSGGLALKDGDSMHLMRYDMNGAAAAIGAMCAIAGMGLKMNVVAVVAACENMIGERAYRNGDVLTAMDGTTVYVSNTDAEGRLTLADALSYIVKYEKPSSVMCVAGLTGALTRFYGRACAAALTATPEMYRRLRSLAQITGENYAQMPYLEEYQEMLKTSIADLCNFVDSAGSITAGMFIDAFKKDTPFMHIDFGTVVFTGTPGDCQPQGGTGFGVSSIYHYVKALAEEK